MTWPGLLLAEISILSKVALLYEEIKYIVKTEAGLTIYAPYKPNPNLISLLIR